jgi:hypothetical protein
VRAHSASEQDDARRVISFKARADGLGALRGQVELALLPGDDATTTQIDYVVWATASGPLAELPGRQIERALHQWTDDFFREFGAVVQAKHGLVPNRAASSAPRRQHVFLRPASLMAAAKRPLPHLGGALSGRAASAVQPAHRGRCPCGRGPRSSCSLRCCCTRRAGSTAPEPLRRRGVGCAPAARRSGRAMTATVPLRHMRPRRSTTAASRRCSTPRRGATTSSSSIPRRSSRCTMRRASAAAARHCCCGSVCRASPCTQGG